VDRGNLSTKSSLFSNRAFFKKSTALAVKQKQTSAGLQFAFGAEKGVTFMKPLHGAAGSALAVIAAFLFCSQVALASRADRVVLRGLEKPFAVVAAPDGMIWISEKPGRIKIFDSKFQLQQTLTAASGNFPDFVFFGEGGVLDIAFHPQFSSNRQIYIAYSVLKNGEYLTRVNRFVFSQGVLSDHRIIFDGPGGTAGTHFGCRLAFDANGILFASFGERRDMHKAQDMTLGHGKIVRLQDDGMIPRDNPFGSRNPIFSLGHRNPQGLAFRPSDGRLFSSEHGPTIYDAPEGGDEVNEIRAGQNYGWPLYHHRETAPGFVAPIAEYTPAVAPSGIAFYTGSKISEWTGDLFVAMLRGRYLLRLRIDGGGRVSDQEKLLSGRYGRLRDVETSASGAILVLSDDGRLIEVR